jgi:4-amino-4-deoxy-L-arabinose transferase-like glycosyltransferase
LTGLILCGSYQYIEQGRIGRVDMTLCFFETMAVLAFMWWYAGKEREDKSEASGQGASMGLPPNRTAMKMGPAVPQSTVRVMPESLPLTRGRLGGGHLGESPIFMPEETASGRSDSYRRGWLRYLFALALGLAVLAKGPVGAILPAAACGIFLLAERRFDDLREIAAPGPVLLAVLTGGSWYAACLLARRYGFLGRQLGSENFGRFFGALGTMPPWYYIKPLLLNSGPLSLMVPLAVFFALHTYWQHPSAPAPPDAPPLARDSDGRVLSVRAQDAVRLFAIFWLVSVAFFTVAAYKRRAYLLPLWPASAVLLAWWVQTSALSSPRWGRLLRGFLVISSCGLIIFNTVLLPQREVRECAGDSRKDAAMEIDRIVGRSEPLYLYGFGGEPAPLLFYLDRDAPPVEGKLGDAPPGYVIVPAPVWRQHQAEALDLTPVFQSTTGRPPIVLLRHGKALASQ